MKIKIIFLFTVILIIVIFKLTYVHKLNYVSLGDELSIGKTNLNTYTKSFSYLLKEELLKEKKLKSYNDFYTKEGLLIKETIKEITNNLDHENINQIIKQANILTLSYGMTELKETMKKEELSYLEKNNKIIEIYNDYSTLINKIRKLNDCEIFIIGLYYIDERKYLVDELETLLKTLENKNTIYIEIKKEFEFNINYLPTNNYPTEEGYNFISNKIIETLKDY